MIEQTYVTEFVDKETGEVLQYESKKVCKKKVNSENFYMVFFDYFKNFNSLRRSAVNNNVLNELCKRAEFNTGIVNMSQKIRDAICTEFGISKTQLSNSLKALREDDLISLDRGEYKVNPQIFWKGDQRIRKEELLKNKKLQVTYEIVDSDESDIN